MRRCWSARLRAWSGVETRWVCCLGRRLCWARRRGLGVEGRRGRLCWGLFRLRGDCRVDQRVEIHSSHTMYNSHVYYLLRSFIMGDGGLQWELLDHKTKCLLDKQWGEEKRDMHFRLLGPPDQGRRYLVRQSKYTPSQVNRNRLERNMRWEPWSIRTFNL